MAGYFDELLRELAQIDQGKPLTAPPPRRPGPTPVDLSDLLEAHRKQRSMPPLPPPATILADLQDTRRVLHKALIGDSIGQLASAYSRLREMAAAGRITALQAAKAEALLHRLGDMAAAATAQVTK